MEEVGVVGTGIFFLNVLFFCVKKNSEFLSNEKFINFAKHFL